MTVTGTRPRTSLAFESAVFAGRLFIVWRRRPIVPIQALLFPSVLLITYALLVSKSMTRITGANSLEVLVPICAVAGGMTGAVGAAMLIPTERDGGLLSRFFMLPVHRSSPLAGTLLAEAIRTAVGTVIITVVGILLGLDFDGNWLAFVTYILVPVLVVVVYATIVLTIAVRAKGRTMLTWLGTASIGLVFSAVAPVERVPEVFQPIAKLQPMRQTIESMRALSQGDPALGPLLVTCAWLLGLAIIFAPVAIRGYRIAAESGH